MWKKWRFRLRQNFWKLFFLNLDSQLYLQTNKNVNGWCLCWIFYIEEICDFLIWGYRTLTSSVQEVQAIFLNEIICRVSAKPWSVYHGGKSKGITCAVDRDVAAYLAVDRGFRFPTEQYGCQYGQFTCFRPHRASKTLAYMIFIIADRQRGIGLYFCAFMNFLIQGFTLETCVITKPPFFFIF